MSIQIELDRKEVEREQVIFNYSMQAVTDNKSIRTFITDSINTSNFYMPEVIIKFAPLHYRIGGMTTKISTGTYFIQLNRNQDLATIQRTLFHEYVHVLQFHRSWLNTDGDIVEWRGSYYSWSLPWYVRPWEVNAEAYTNKLFKPDLN